MGPVCFISFFAWPEISWLAGNQLWMLFSRQLNHASALNIGLCFDAEAKRCDGPHWTDISNRHSISNRLCLRAMAVLNRISFYLKSE